MRREHREFDLNDANLHLHKPHLGLVIVTGLALLLGGFFLLDPLIRHDAVSHYRLTAEFTVDGKPVKVSQVYGYDCPAPMAAAHASTPCNLRGEAMRADLGSYGSVFILMNAWAPDGKALAGHDTLVRNLLLAEVHRQPVAAEALPVMVRFRDPNDPKTVEAVDPAHLDANVKLVRVTVSNASQATQYGLVAPALPWLSALKGDRLDRDSEQTSPAYRLHGFDFVWAG
jgi:hypothetical protein